MEDVFNFDEFLSGTPKTIIKESVKDILISMKNKFD